ncbi:sulfur carrier protein ThiS [Methylocapsa acidiphila]|uniref:sulfur carrier protein ThiS n=1 Tax=Methylocapsa acidiphila TaxID=133552 RepID=UPI000409E38C|nr:sulfur carrier protein ThiS [Methylocapsa acidiphila]
MRIKINGEARDVTATTLAALLRELDYEDLTVATALNQAFVRKTDRNRAHLRDGDAVEILTPRQGG